VAIKEVGDKFHKNFQAGYKAHPLKYKGVNLGISTHVQSKVRARAKARMITKGHVLAWLQQPSINKPTPKCGGGGARGEGTKKPSKSKKGGGGLGSFPR